MKYKLTDCVIGQSHVTLTSYLVHQSDEDHKVIPLDTQAQATSRCVQIPDDSIMFSGVEEGKFSQMPKGSFTEWIKQKTRRCFTKKKLQRRIPILSWLPRYKTTDAISDLVAGITVGLTVIPQAIAYSNIAGLPPQIGLYSSFMACFVYTIFGSCKDSPIGPTAISALLTLENSRGFGVDGAVLLCFLTGCAELLMGVLQLGFVIDFISGPVSAGFTSAAAVIIATTQVKDILGLDYPGGNFLQVWTLIFEHIGETRVWDCVLGVSCLVVLLVLRKIKDLRVSPLFDGVLWLIATARNIIVVLLCSVLAYVFQACGREPFALTGYVKPGLPDLAIPAFSTHVGNCSHGFTEMASSFGTGIFIVPLFGILENIALAKAFANGRSIDATQEMLALGACNIASSFFGAMPVTGALSRGAVNNASGVKTTLGGVYTGVIVILSLQLFTPYFFYIPKACLAAVIIAAVVFMVEFHVVKPMWRSKKTDLIPAFATFLTCLSLRLELGVVIGVGINLITLLYTLARPVVHVAKVTSAFGSEYLLITPDRSLTFPSVEYVRAVVTKAGEKHGCSSTPVVIDARYIQGADFTAAQGIKTLIGDFCARKQPILFYNLKPSVVSIFEGVRPNGFVYCQTLPELNELLKEFTKV